MVVNSYIRGHLVSYPPNTTTNRRRSGEQQVVIGFGDELVPGLVRRAIVVLVAVFGRDLGITGCQDSLFGQRHGTKVVGVAEGLTRGTVGIFLL